MKINGILIHPSDQVITLSLAVKEGETVWYVRGGTVCSLQAKEDIPQYHKMAVFDVKKEQRVLKYGEEIGEAITDIAAGQWVHVHNLQSVCMAGGKQKITG